MDVADEFTGIHLLRSTRASNYKQLHHFPSVWHSFNTKINVFLDITRSEFQKQTNNDRFTPYW